MLSIFCGFKRFYNITLGKGRKSRRGGGERGKEEREGGGRKEGRKRVKRRERGRVEERILPLKT